MDGSRFDALSRMVAAGSSRRGLMRLLGGLALVGPLTLVGQAETTAKRKKHKKKHRRASPPPPESSPPPPPPVAFCEVPGLPQDLCPSLCRGDGNCDLNCGVCIPTVEGPGLCMRGVSCATAQPCNTTADCPAGYACNANAPGLSCFNVCRPTCPQNVCGTRDACVADAFCGTGGQCFQPFGGGGFSRCATVAPGSCGAGSSEECATRFGAGAFLVQFAPGRCTCGDMNTTFCAIPIAT
jgi:hypothetical protein